ncbi:MAG: hypothetical protein KKD74_14125 [Bacteroidetes bacterium]|nr:hypothetical protein [Bacteroidota bacterium]
MKKPSILIVLMLACAGLFAQSPVGVGEKQINFGAGFSSSGIPIYVGMDFGVHPDISVGFNASLRSYGSEWAGNDYNFTAIGIIGNGNYHFNRILNIPQPWDVYAGLSLGYVIVSAPSGYGGSVGSDFGLEAQIGGRYYWNDRWAINLQFGGGNVVSGTLIGVTYKL